MDAVSLCFDCHCVVVLRVFTPPPNLPSLTMAPFVATRFQIVTLLAYSQMRKMMSVVVKSEDDKYYLFSKGADTKILSRLASDTDAAARQATEEVRSGDAVFGCFNIVAVFCC